MKRSLVTITLIMSAGLLALSGQFPSSFGAKAGISLANQSYQFTALDYEMETEALVGPVFSLFLEAFKGKQFSFQLDLSYAQKGSKTSTQSITVDHMSYDQIIVNEGEQSTSTFSYFSLMPMLRYRLGKGPLYPYFLLGPRVDFLLKYKTDSEYPLDDQNKVIPGLTFGTGLEYQLEKLLVFTELQYQGDFIPVTGQDPLLVNNHMLSLTLGIRWIGSD